MEKIRHCAVYDFRDAVIWKSFSDFCRKAVSDFGKREFERPTPIKIYGWKNNSKFNIIQIPDRRIVMVAKPRF